MGTNRETLYQAKKRTVQALARAGIERAESETEWLLCSLKKISRSRLLLIASEAYLTEEEVISLSQMVQRRISGEPLQYIIGYESFWGRDFLVGPGCLIPRPETELVVEEALRHFVKGSFLDWGTGSGCIVATILAERPLSRGVAVEVSPQAIEWAWKNLRRYNLLHRCLLWHSREMSDIPVPSQSLDLIISNPPYIPTATIGRLMKEVVGYEPYVALNGGEDGLLYYKELLHVAPNWLKPGGMLVVELGDSIQGEVFANYNALGLRLINLAKDFQGIYRIAVWRRV